MDIKTLVDKFMAEESNFHNKLIWFNEILWTLKNQPNMADFEYIIGECVSKGNFELLQAIGQFNPDYAPIIQHKKTDIEKSVASKTNSDNPSSNDWINFDNELKLKPDERIPLEQLVKTFVSGESNFRQKKICFDQIYLKLVNDPNNFENNLDTIIANGNSELIEAIARFQRNRIERMLLQRSNSEDNHLHNYFKLLQDKLEPAVFMKYLNEALVYVPRKAGGGGPEIDLNYQYQTLGNLILKAGLNDTLDWLKTVYKPEGRYFENPEASAKTIDYLKSNNRNVFSEVFLGHLHTKIVFELIRLHSDYADYYSGPNSERAMGEVIVYEKDPAKKKVLIAEALNPNSNLGKFLRRHLPDDTPGLDIVLSEASKSKSSEENEKIIGDINRISDQINSKKTWHIKGGGGELVRINNEDVLVPKGIAKIHKILNNPDLTPYAKAFKIEEVITARQQKNWFSSLFRSKDTTKTYAEMQETMASYKIAMKNLKGESVSVDSAEEQRSSASNKF